MKVKRRIPHPATMFFLLTLGVILLSWIFDIYGLRVFHPQTGEEVRVQSLLSPEGIRWMLRHVVSNFTGFAPLGMTIVAMFGMGVARHSGLIDACIRRWSGRNRRPQHIVLCVILTGLLSNVVGDAGYILLLPIAALLFQAVGLSPVGGIVVAYVSVSCGYSANLLLSTLDPLLAATTREVADTADISFGRSGPLCNYYFLATSVGVLACVLYTVTYRHLLPRLRRKEPPIPNEPWRLLSHKERRAMTTAWIAGGSYTLLLVLLTCTPYGILRGVSGGLIHSPFLAALLFLLSFGIGLMGMVYGFAAGRYRTDGDVIEGLGESMRSLGGYFVMAFFASQMIACLEHSRLDYCWAIWGADHLASTQLSGLGTLILFIMFTAAVNLLMVSASTKWTFMAFIFLPLLADKGIAPDVTQCAFRIGDSATNAITPFLYYMPLVLTYLQQHHPKATYATLLSYTWRYSLCVLLAWTLLFIGWFLSGWPLGL